ncbi:Root cap [Dillenia turbinata]|uniref:Root cap n=1 Tax=Dillenia turbinata TaxID=194707 RepID=A0AAN8VFP6_9MAGN
MGLPVVRLRGGLCLVLFQLIVLILPNVSDAQPEYTASINIQGVKWVYCKTIPNNSPCSSNAVFAAQCPQNCLHNCFMDCTNTCQPYCPISPPPPPPPPSPPPPSPRPPSPPPPSPSPPPPSPPPPSPPPPSPSPPHPSPPPRSPSPPPPSPSLPLPSPPPASPPPHSPSPPPPIPPPRPSPSPPPPSPSPLPSKAKKVKCKNKDYPTCYHVPQYCPSACPESCEVDCVTCSPVCNCNRPGAVCQDPQFVGGDGLTFYFHGKKDKDFCIVTDSSLHINAHFIGRRNENMNRDFTWVQSLGILFDTHELYVAAKKTATWDDSVDRLALAFDGEPISLPGDEGAIWQSSSLPRVTITRSTETNAVVIEAEGNFKIKAMVVPITQKDSEIHNYGITGEDCFAHLDLSFKFYSLSGEVNGVLGQTYASNYESRVKMGVSMPVLGGNKEFSSSSLFATDCEVAQFKGHFNSTTKADQIEYPRVNCSSGMDGIGVVCKK